MKKISPLIFILSPIVFTFYYFFTFQSNVPFADDWSAINGLVIRFFYGNDTWIQKIQLFFAQCNEHREGFLALIALPQYALLGHINYTFFNLIGIFGSLSMAAVFGRFFAKNQFSVIFFIPIVFVLLNASYYHNFYWPTCALQHNSVVLFVLLSLYFLYQKKPIALAIGMGAIAIFTSANGFLLFAAAIPLLKNYSKRSQFAWAIAGVVLFLLYVNGYQQPAQRNSLFQNILMIKELILTAFTYLGAFCAVFLPNASALKIPLSIGLGIFVAILILIQFYQGFLGKHRANIAFLFSISLQLFVVLTVGLYALSRANLPLEAVYESRYGINHAILLCSFILQLSLISNNQKIGLMLSGFSILFFASSYYFRSLEIYQFNRNNIASIWSQAGNHRDFFYHFQQGQKRDLTAPTITSLSQIPKPLVDFTAILPSSGKYYNDVIQATFVNNVYQLPTNLAGVHQQIVINKVERKSTDTLDFRWEVTKDRIAFMADKLKVNVQNGMDGYYLILRNKSIKPIVYALQFHEVDYKQQILHPFSVCLRKADCYIPFSILPDGSYEVQVVQVEKEAIQLISQKNFDLNM